MKKLVGIVVVFVLAVAVMVSYNKAEVMSTYNQLPGNTTWKIEKNVECPDGSFGFRLVSKDGKDSYWKGNPAAWDINLETGEVQ